MHHCFYMFVFTESIIFLCLVSLAHALTCLKNQTHIVSPSRRRRKRFRCNNPLRIEFPCPYVIEKVQPVLSRAENAQPVLSRAEKSSPCPCVIENSSRCSHVLKKYSPCSHVLVKTPDRALMCFKNPGRALTFFKSSICALMP